MPTTLNPEAREAVEDYLKSLGFRILDRDWRCPHDRIDLLAAERDTLVACVIQTRRRGTTIGSSSGPISQTRCRSLRNLAAAWLTAHGARYEQIRIDVATLMYEGTGGYVIEHSKAVG